MCNNLAQTFYSFAAENKRIMGKNSMSMKRGKRFMNAICAKMNKAGYSAKVEDGLLVIGDGEKDFIVEMWDIGRMGKRRVHFNLQFAMDGMDTMDALGLAALASECNNHADFTTIQFLSDHFLCRLESVVRTPKEFVREFGFAYKMIGQSYMTLAKNYPMFHEHFKKEEARRPIGFLADRYMPQEESPEPRNSLAHKGCIFAA